MDPQNPIIISTTILLCLLLLSVFGGLSIRVLLRNQMEKE
ncbi:hypothetical protein J2Z37_001870 [Ammoniphilus resinae]|uniref:Uncharacterized protein n=1 Tax=Ammoniphilus resinae TaxID=861532 RepID=A0ABS4GNP5_9BACL|nr:hypothetical protein [Ammoniphilus resinae]